MFGDEMRWQKRIKRGVREAWSWKRGNGWRLIVRPQKRQEDRVEYSQD